MVVENKTSVMLLCIIEGKEYTILPKSEIYVEVEKNIVINVCHMYESSRKELFDIINVFHIVINSTITVDDIHGDGRIIISGEVALVSMDYAYDRFFIVAQNCQVAKERLVVSNLRGLKNQAKDNKLKDTHMDRIMSFLLSGGFWMSTGLFLLFKIVFWANNWPLSWWLIVLFWLVGYGIQILGEKTYYLFIQKKQPRLLELEKYVSEENILRYYNNPNRQWIIGHKIDL